MHGFVTYSSGFQGETLTPTGAAILKVLCSDGRRPLMVTERSGYGAGTKDFPVANVLRIQLGKAVVDELNGLHPSTQITAAAMNSESACVLEANIDDMNPEWAAYVVHQLLELGAMDAWLTPIVMKKGRPGLQLHVLCNIALRNRVIQQIHLETTTIGVRHYEVSRFVLPREVLPVDTPYGVIRVKVAYQDERVVNVAPEFEDCRLCAEDRGVPLKEVYAAAMAAYRQRV